MNTRTLAWEGCHNVRDLGGLPTTDGRLTRLGAIIRSDTPTRLTPAGWAALHAYGVRTILTLCTHGLEEPELTVTPRYPELTTQRLAIEDITDQAFVERWVHTNLWGTPLYYHDALRRWPGRHAAVISAIARAQPGGVLFHCKRGHDRTGIITLLLLTLVGAQPEAITADYALSVDPDRDALLAREHTTARDVLLGTATGLEIDQYLIAGGATSAELALVRQRLLG